MCHSRLCHPDRRVRGERTHFAITAELSQPHHGHALCTEPDMRQTRFGLGRFALAGVVPVMVLAACGSSTGSEHQSQAGAGAVVDESTGGSKAGASSAGASSAGAGGAAAGSSGSGGSLNHAGSGGNQAGAAGSSGANAAGAGSSGGNAGGAGGEPLACGSMTCGASQYCVIPCCGGTAPACFPASSDGTCPTGSHSGCNSNLGQCTSPASCCQYDPCSAPPPYCSDSTPTLCFPSPGVPGPPQNRICRMMCA